MTRNVYALLVGIDQYPPTISPLKGCVNDILAIETYLRGRITQEQLHLRILLNEKATRQAVIDGFREHLCQSSSADTALFYFAGHGSQDKAPSVFKHMEPDGLCEAIVCYDSRTEGNWDLADKELAQLILEVADNNPHIAIVMDCCHAGSGSRVTQTRRVPIDERERSPESFILDNAQVEQLFPPRDRTCWSGWNLPVARYVFLAACRDHEEAGEYQGGGQWRGTFSYFLSEALEKNHGGLTYRDLFKQTQARLVAHTATQSPQLEGHTADWDQPFLGGAIAPLPPYFTASYRLDYSSWVIDGGTIHGMVAPKDNETTTLALFPLNSSPQQMARLADALGTAQVTEVLPQLSKISIGSCSLDNTTTYKAIVTHVPLPRVLVSFTGDSDGVDLARQALCSASSYGDTSLYVREASPDEAADLQLVAQDGKYLIVQPIDQRPLVAAIEGFTLEQARVAIARLKHIARWRNIVNLANPAVSRIPSNAVQMQILQNGEEITSPEIRLEYQYHEGKPQKPSFQIKLKNISQETLYCAVLCLTDRYAVKPLPFGTTPGIWLKPDEVALAAHDKGNTFYAEVPKDLAEQQGITELKDLYKLIVCTAEFDVNLLKQGNLDTPPTRSVGSLAGRQSTLNRLMHRVQSRDWSTSPDDEIAYDDWATSQMTMTVVRPQATKAIPSVGDSVDLGAGVKVQGHAALQARVRLTTVPQATRSLNQHFLPAILRLPDANVQPLQFTTSRGNNPGLSVLELSKVENHAAVTPTAPLTLTVNQPLRPSEEILACAYDGEFYLPLGHARIEADHITKVELQRLPEPTTADGSRSLAGSIQIFFQKITSEKLGLAFDYPILAAVDMALGQQICYILEEAQVTARVAQSRRILLYIHGIIGESRNLVDSVRTASIEMNGQSRSLAEHYDLILTFDYENLNTSIENNAQSLKQRLAAIGLTANHDKTLHIVAHSMGGLVARWFIEREGGNQVVQHLIMLGTPNGGSPWAKVQDWAIAALAISLNGLSMLTWPVPVIGQLLRLAGTGVGAIETLDVTLDQMSPNSDFLKSLATSPDPGIPYTIIAGNTSLIPAATQPKSANQAPQIERLMKKLFDRVVDLPFFEQPNDIAVAVHSIKNIPTGRSPAPITLEAACDHCVYFTSTEGLQKLAEAIAKALS